MLTTTPLYVVADMATACILAGQRVTLSLPKDVRRPPGLPRGELLSVNPEGTRNYSFDPVRILRWVQQQRC